MNDEIRKHLVRHNEKHEWGTSDAELMETLLEAKRIHREELSQHRWWNEYRYVVEIDGMLIGFVYAEANRDESVKDLGYDFNWSKVCKVRRIEKMAVGYVPEG